MGGGWVSQDGEKNGSRRMGFMGWGMVKGVGHGGGAMGWRGGDQLQQQEVTMKKKKIEKGSRCGLHFGETALFHYFYM